jgi:molybdopterin-guanine dinucleotide biosynthesis protein A
VSDAYSIVILAGGRAKRLPGKLQAEFGGTTLLARVIENLKPLGAEIVLSIDADFDPAVAEELGIRTVVDVTPERGPVAALASTIATVGTPYFFAAPGDAPFVDASFVTSLALARRDGDEAVVAFEGDAPLGRLHPLPAFYERAAFIRAARKALATEKPSLHAVLGTLAVRRVAFPDGDLRLLNVNTSEDLESAKRKIEPI